MSKVPWNRVYYEEFVSLSFLTAEEEKILKTRVAGWSQTKQCEAFKMSLATLNRRIGKIKAKYVAAQRYSKILPRADEIDL